MKMIHPFHMVTNSPWPLILSINLMNFFMSMLLWLNFMNKNHLIFNIIITLTTLMIWWRDIIRESTYQGFHTNTIHSFMKFSMILFIISEMFFFMAFFWSYFHSSISPNIEIGMSWPPKFIMIFNPYDIPLLNTIILISSSFTLTISHYKMMMNNFLMSKKYLILTLILSLYFSLLQYIEYKNSLFCINDSIYGSIFFMTTGFHGLHVMIGSMFLLSSLIRINLNHFSYTHHFNFTASIWYWHFVDLIWLFLYLSIYWFMY